MERVKSNRWRRTETGRKERKSEREDIRATVGCIELRRSIGVTEQDD